MVRSTKGAKISAAKKGVRQLELAPGELTLTDAVRETGLSYRVLRDGVDLPGPDGEPKLRHRRVARACGRATKRSGAAEAIIFNREHLQEDLAACPCSYPRCNKPAPGKSGRCGDHRARGEPAIELVCQDCGRTFVRPVSWLREREGRGHYCSNEHKGLAHAAANPGRLETLNPDGAREHHAGVAAKIKAKGRLDRYRAEKSPLNLYGYSASHICASLGETTVIDGSRRCEIDPSQLVAWEPPWADQLDRRVDIAYRRTKDPGVKGRLGGSIERKWTREQALDVLRYHREGKTVGQIEYLTGLTRRQVRYILDR
jgi:hypothetical protein